MRGLGEDASAVQRAISERLGAILQHTATFVVGFIIAFLKSKYLTSEQPVTAAPSSPASSSPWSCTVKRNFEYSAWRLDHGSFTLVYNERRLGHDTGAPGLPAIPCCCGSYAWKADQQHGEAQLHSICFCWRTCQAMPRAGNCPLGAASNLALQHQILTCHTNITASRWNMHEPASRHQTGIAVSWIWVSTCQDMAAWYIYLVCLFIYVSKQGT